MQNYFDKSVAQERFNLNKVYNDIFLSRMASLSSYQNYFTQINQKLGKKYGKKVIQRIIRFSYYIEPVKKPKIESTKFAVRWSSELTNDPRFASYNSCKNIFDMLFFQLIESLENPDKVFLLKRMIDKANVSYEIPVDYISRTNTSIHTPTNISWVWTELPQKVVNLRAYLTDESMHDYAQIFKAIYKKIRVKTYLTDRVLTGTHKTNREKRWECHPQSVHFALRRVAWGIEYKLIRQVCHFDGFPNELQKDMIRRGIFRFNSEITRCPITYELLSFEELKEEVSNATHGKSNFQVGHMHPLKTISEDEATGHQAANISWISEQGNRIQGNNSVGFIRLLIKKIYENYQRAGLFRKDKDLG